MLAADGLKHGAGDLLASQRGAHGGPAAVVVATGKRAGERVAGLASLNTDLLFCRECERAQAEARLAQVGACLLGHRASHGARGEVEDAFELALPQGLDRREEHGDGLADASGSFEEEAPAASEHAVGGHRERPLAGAIPRKGESE